jgi:hypothetical protein
LKETSGATGPERTLWIVARHDTPGLVVSARKFNDFLRDTNTLRRTTLPRATLEGRILSYPIGTLHLDHKRQVLVPAHDLARAPELPVPRYPGSVVTRSWAPPPGYLEVNRQYAVCGSSFSSIEKHYGWLRAASVTVDAVTREEDARVESGGPWIGELLDQATIVMAGWPKPCIQFGVRASFQTHALAEKYGRDLDLEVAVRVPGPRLNYRSTEMLGHTIAQAPLARPWPRVILLPHKLASDVPVAELGQAVAAGSVLIVLANERASDYDFVPVPAGSRLRVWGWRNEPIRGPQRVVPAADHPAVISVPAAGADLDRAQGGHIAELPAGSTILLRRLRDKRPVMAMYPLGRGFVVVSAVGVSEYGALATVLRDTLAWAASTAPIPAVSLDLANESSTTAAAVRVRVESAGRLQMLHEETRPLKLASGSRAVLPLGALQLPPTQPGLLPVDFELLDGTGNVVQPVHRAWTRWLQARAPAGEPPAAPLAAMTALVADDGVRGRMVLTMTSNSAQPLRLELRETRSGSEYAWGKGAARQPVLVAVVELPAHGEVQRDLEVHQRTSYTLTDPERAGASIDMLEVDP